MTDHDSPSGLGLPGAVALIGAVLHRRARGRDDALEWAVAALEFGLDRGEILGRHDPLRPALRSELQQARYWLARWPIAQDDAAREVATCLGLIAGRLQEARAAREGVGTA